MARTLTNLRQLIASELGLRFISGTADAGGSTTTLKDSILQNYPNDSFIGSYVYLSSGSPSDTELIVTDSVQSTGLLTFVPTLGAAPDTLTYEILPFSATDIRRAVQEATYEAYDQGTVVRPVSCDLIIGSPVYNADWSYWTSSSVADGWARNGTGTIARERSSANVHRGSTSLKLSAVADYVTNNGFWQRWLYDMRGQTVTFYCPVKTSTANIARINLYTGSNNYSPYHGGGGQWEILQVAVAVSKTATDLELRLYNDGTAAVYFGMPWVDGLNNVTEYPFPRAILPDGPDFLMAGNPLLLSSDVASGRGTSRLRHLSGRFDAPAFRTLRHHDENTTTEFMVADMSANSYPFLRGDVISMYGSGPLTVPTADTDNLEVNEQESELLAVMSALNLLQKGITRLPVSQRPIYRERLAHLTDKKERLKGGVGNTRGAASLPLRW